MLLIIKVRYQLILHFIRSLTTIINSNKKQKLEFYLVVLLRKGCNFSNQFNWIMSPKNNKDTLEEPEFWYGSRKTFSLVTLLVFLLYVWILEWYHLILWFGEWGIYATYPETETTNCSSSVNLNIYLWFNELKQTRIWNHGKMKSKRAFFLKQKKKNQQNKLLQLVG